MYKFYTETKILQLIIIGMSIAPAFFLGEGNRNLFLIGLMTLSPILFISKLDRINKIDILLIIFLITLILFPMMNQPDTIRWSTVSFSFMFGITFLAYKQILLGNYLSLRDYHSLIKLILYAYFIVLVIQQFCVLFGLPIFNVMNHTYLDPWKLNSLSAEPSHTARIVALLFYSHIVITEIINNDKYSFSKYLTADRFLLFAFVWVMLTSNSSTAILFFLIIFIKYLNYKDSLILITFVLIFLFLGFNIENSSFDRTISVIVATLSFDTAAIISADHSASIRIVPIILLIDKIDLLSINGWFGNGIDYVSTFLYSIMPGVKEGFTAGALLALLIEYGLISFFLFIIFSFITVIEKRDILTYFFWFFLIFMYNLNSQILWLCLIILYTNKYFKRIYKS